MFLLAAATVINLGTQVTGNIPAANEAIISTTVGQDGVWAASGWPLGIGMGNLTTGTPVNSTMYVYQMNLQRTQVIGHTTIDVTTAGTAETWYTCLYNAAGTTLLWSASGTVNAIAVTSFSAAQYTAYPGVYLAAYEQTGTTSAIVETSTSANAGVVTIINQNGNRFSTSANKVSAGACPTSLGTLTAINSTINPLIALEP